jgi:hypothetical protein
MSKFNYFDIFFTYNNNIKFDMNQKCFHENFYYEFSKNLRCGIYFNEKCLYKIRNFIVEGKFLNKFYKKERIL